MKTIEKSKKQLIEELKQNKGFGVRRYYSKEEINKIARENGVELTIDRQEIREGWIGCHKRLLQVLYERGWINEGELDKY